MTLLSGRVKGGCGGRESLVKDMSLSKNLPPTQDEPIGAVTQLEQAGCSTRFAGKVYPIR